MYRGQKQKGFTIVELLVVVVVIAILATFAQPVGIVLHKNSGAIYVAHSIQIIWCG